MPYQIEQNEIRYEENGAPLAHVTFEDHGPGVVAITHTFVDDTLRGRGIAGELMVQLLQQLRADGRRAVPVCSYAVSWFEKHPEAADVLAAGGE